MRLLGSGSRVQGSGFGVGIGVRFMEVVLRKKAEIQVGQ